MSYTITPFINPCPIGNDITNAVAGIALIDNNFLVAQSFTDVLGNTLSIDATSISTTNDLTLQSGNQITINTYDNINLNAGVNILASTETVGTARFNTKNGTFIAGDADGNYNKTALSIDDTTQDIYTTTPNGRIWSGDVNEVGTTARTRFDVSKRLMSMQCGHQAPINTVGDSIGTKIEEYCNFINTDVDVQMKQASDYFNDLTPNGDGWYCYIMNFSGADIQITSDDGRHFINRTIGGIQPSASLSKFTTARLTLTYISPLGDYFWSFMSGF